MAKKSNLIFVLLAQLVLLCAIAACNFRPVFYPKVPKDGTPLYRLGFSHGCDTGVTIYGNDMVRLMNTGKIDPKLMENKTYANAWKLGNRYCQMYLSQMQMEGWALRYFGTPVYPNRMVPYDDNLARERVIDGVWWNVEFQDQPYSQIESPWFQMETGQESFFGVGPGINSVATPNRFNNFGVQGVI